MGWLKKFLKKIWDVIRKVLAVILVVMAVYFLVMAVAVTSWAMAGYGLLALSAAFLIDSTTARETVDQVGQAVEQAVEAVADIASDAFDGAARGLGIDKLLLYGAAAFAGYWFFIGRRKESTLVLAGASEERQTNTVSASAFRDVSPDIKEVLDRANSYREAGGDDVQGVLAKADTYKEQT